MKKISSLFLTVLLLVTVSFTPVMAAAQETGAIVMSIQTGDCSLKITGMTAKASINVNTLSSDSISVTLYLQKYKDGAWTSVKSTTKSTTADDLSFSMTKLITAGKFRTKAVVTVKDGSNTETKTYYSSVVVKE